MIGEIEGTNSYGRVAYADMLESLVHKFEECKALLTKLKNESSPNPILFLVDTSHIITLIKVKSKKYLLTTEQVLNSLILIHMLNLKMISIVFLNMILEREK